MAHDCGHLLQSINTQVSVYDYHYHLTVVYLQASSRLTVATLVQVILKNSMLELEHTYSHRYFVSKIYILLVIVLGFFCHLFQETDITTTCTAVLQCLPMCLED